MRLVFLLTTALTLSTTLANGARAEDAPTAPPNRVAIHAARMLDVESGRVVIDPMVLVEGDKIVSVDPGGSAPAGTPVIELGDVTLRPGRIDVHVHITGDSTVSTGNYYRDILTRDPVDEAVTAHVFAKRTLYAGKVGAVKPGYFANMVAVSGDPLADVSVREHINFVMKGGRLVRGAAQP